MSGAPGAARAAPRLPEILLEPGTLVLGDLHLDVSPRGAPPERFANWLRALEDVPRVVILGDLFDAWVGPSHLRLPAARAVCELLAELPRRGTALEVLHGNRDFLLDRAFERGSRLVLPGRQPVALVAEVVGHGTPPRDLVDGLLSNRHPGVTLDEDLVASASGRIISPGECESCPVTGLRGVPVSVSVLVPEGAELESDA